MLEPLVFVEYSYQRANSKWAGAGSHAVSGDGHTSNWAYLFFIVAQGGLGVCDDAHRCFVMKKVRGGLREWDANGLNINLLGSLCLFATQPMSASFSICKVDGTNRNYSLSLRIEAIRRGLRRPCITARTHRGFCSGA